MAAKNIGTLQELPLKEECKFGQWVIRYGFEKLNESRNGDDMYTCVEEFFLALPKFAQLVARVNKWNLENSTQYVVRNEDYHLPE